MKSDIGIVFVWTWVSGLYFGMVIMLTTIHYYRVPETSLIEIIFWTLVTGLFTFIAMCLYSSSKKREP